MLSGEATNTDFMVFGLTRPGLEPTRNYRTPSNLPKGKAKLTSQQTDKISQQPENWKNRNGPDLVQAFPKKWWVESHLI
jgi:hypothetical protein